MSHSIIFIIGLPGTGKTTLSKKIATILNFKFCDLDNYIEQEFKVSITDIFEQFGETKFRQYERQSLLKISNEKNIVIATGGGTPCFFDNIELMNTKGITVYIDTPIKIIASRLIKSKTKRPLLEKVPKEKLTEHLSELLSQRENYYNQAKIKYNPITESFNKLIVEIQKYN